MDSQQARFESLDALRGLCACLVTLFHVQAYSHVYQLTLLRHSYLFVDFFFVLSGFIITANYRARLLAGFSFWNFMFLRVGRVYPLHLAILIAFIGLELARYLFGGLVGGAATEKFSGARSIEAILTNVLLIHSLGVHSTLTWNPPSWSISTEFYTYVVFAIVVQALRNWVYGFVLLVVLGAPVLLLFVVGDIDTQYDFGIIRCLFGFFVGFVLFDLYLLIKRARDWGAVEGSLIEIICGCMVILFVWFSGPGPLSILAPLVFGLAVLTFSFESGILSKLLKLSPFLLLGTLSYSIYMVHWLVESGIYYAVRLVELKWHVALSRQAQLGAEMWQGDLFYAATLIVVVSISYLTYIYIEKPGRRQSRRISDRIFAVAPLSATLQPDRSVADALSRDDRDKSERINSHAATL